MNESKTAVLIWMTNKSRAWLYEKTAREFAVYLGTHSYKESFIDTSWIEDFMQGEKLLTDLLLTYNTFPDESVIILIKDAKWKPKGNKIYTTLNSRRVYLAEVDIKTVERFSRDMDPQGLSNQIKIFLKRSRE